MVDTVFNLAPGEKLDFTFDFSAQLDAISAVIEGSPVVTVTPASPALTVVSTTILTGDKKVAVVLTHSTTDVDVEWGIECKINATQTPDRDFKAAITVRAKPALIAAAGGLTTPARVIAELDITAASKLALVADYILEATDIIHAYCGRTFAKQTGIVETVLPYSPTTLMLAQTPVASIASITLDGTTVDSSAYSLDNAAAGLVRSANSWITQQRYVVTYTAGYILPGTEGRTLPRSIERACIMLVKQMLYGRKDSSIKSEAVPDVYSVTYSDTDSSSLPADVKELLAPYKRRRV